MKKTISIICTMLLCSFFSQIKAQNADQPATTTQTTSTAEMTFKNLEHDYGTINKDANGDCEFEFKNTGKEPIIITNCQGSCGCTVPTWTKEPILPGKKGTIKVHYATNRVGAFEKTVTVTSNAKNSPIVLKIKGNVLDTPQPAATPQTPAAPAATPEKK